MHSCKHKNVSSVVFICNLVLDSTIGRKVKRYIHVMTHMHMHISLNSSESLSLVLASLLLEEPSSCRHVVEKGSGAEMVFLPTFSLEKNEYNNNNN